MAIPPILVRSQMLFRSPLAVSLLLPLSSCLIATEVDPPAPPDPLIGRWSQVFEPSAWPPSGFQWSFIFGQNGRAELRSRADTFTSGDENAWETIFVGTYQKDPAFPLLEWTGHASIDSNTAVDRSFRYHYQFKGEYPYLAMVDSDNGPLHLRAERGIASADPLARSWRTGNCPDAIADLPLGQSGCLLALRTLSEGTYSDGDGTWRVQGNLLFLDGDRGVHRGFAWTNHGDTLTLWPANVDCAADGGACAIEDAYQLGRVAL